MQRLKYSKKLSMSCTDDDDDDDKKKTSNPSLTLEGTTRSFYKKNFKI